MKRNTLTSELRRALKESDLSQAELSRRAGVPESVISRFTREITDTITLANADALADVLGLELRKVRKGKKP